MPLSPARCQSSNPNTKKDHATKQGPADCVWVYQQDVASMMFPPSFPGFQVCLPSGLTRRAPSSQSKVTLWLSCNAGADDSADLQHLGYISIDRIIRMCEMCILYIYTHTQYICDMILLYIYICEYIIYIIIIQCNLSYTYIARLTYSRVLICMTKLCTESRWRWLSCGDAATTGSRIHGMIWMCSLW